MAAISEVIQMLEDISRFPSGQIDLIKRFQNLVWEEDVQSVSPEELSTLKDLAYDLDFYEPDPKVREEDESYFDENRLKEEITLSLNKLKGHC